MYQPRTAKLFKNGASQAVRLPADFRFEGGEIYIARDEATGDVLLSSRPGAKTWGDFFALMKSIDVPANFMVKRPLNAVPKERKLFNAKA